MLRKIFTTNAKNAHQITAPRITPSNRIDVSSGGVSLLMAPDAVNNTPNESMVRGLEMVSPKLAAKSPRTMAFEVELFSFLF